MPSLENLFLGNSVLTWLLALGAVIVSLGALLVVKKYVLRRLRRFAERTATRVDDLLVEVLESTRGFAMVGISAYIGSLMLSLPGGAQLVLNRAFVALVFVQGALWGNAAIRYSQRWFASGPSGRDPAAATASRALTFVARVVLWAVIALLVLDNLGVNITGLVAGLGIGGIAVALALQTILGDLFASLSILMDKPFVVGDFIVVDEYLGTIEHIGLKTTRLRSLSGEQLVMPNAGLTSSRIRNFKRMSERRVVLSIDIAYETPPTKIPRATAIIRECITGEEGTRIDRVHFKEFGPSALRLEAVYYALDPDYNRFMDLQQAINLKIFERFGGENIEFAYPTQTVLVREGARNGAVPAGKPEGE